MVASRDVVGVGEKKELVVEMGLTEELELGWRRDELRMV